MAPSYCRNRIQRCQHDVGPTGTREASTERLALKTCGTTRVFCGATMLPPSWNRIVFTNVGDAVNRLMIRDSLSAAEFQLTDVVLIDDSRSLLSKASLCD